MTDAGFSGPKHTWKNGRVLERLDRCLINFDWICRFNHSSVTHLNFMKSDLWPIHLHVSISEVGPTNAPKKSIFLFQPAWLTHENFSSVVREAWKDGKIWLEDKNLF